MKINLFLLIYLVGISCTQEVKKITDQSTSRITYDSITNGTNFKLKHFYEGKLKDSLYLLFNDNSVYQMFIKPEYEEIGLFIDSSITIINENSVFTQNFVINDSILICPISPTINGWLQVFAFNLKTKSVIQNIRNNVDYGLYSRFHIYIMDESIYCISEFNVDYGVLNQYKIKGDQFIKVDSLKIGRKDFDNRNFVIREIQTR